MPKSILKPNDDGTIATPAPSKGLTIIIGGKSASAKKEVDLVFVIDTTGSMSDKIEGLITTISLFANDFSKIGLDYRLGLLSFGDLKIPGDRIDVVGFTKIVQTFQNWLKTINRNLGGGNEGESSFEAMFSATNMPFRDSSLKVLALITDEPAHQDHDPKQLIGRLINGKFITFTIATPDWYYQSMANKTGGNWQQIESNTSLNKIMDIFIKLSRNMTKVISDFYKLEGGNVNNNLLGSGKK